MQRKLSQYVLKTDKHIIYYFHSIYWNADEWVLLSVCMYCTKLKISQCKDLFSTNTHLTSVVCVWCYVLWFFGFAPSNQYCEQMKKLIFIN